MDNVRQKFTGYQRDEETDLDFAEARYYYNGHGRFTAVDPLTTSGKSDDPQTFNRYAYTMNRPLVLTDSSGLQAGEEVVRINTTLCRDGGTSCMVGINRSVSFGGQTTRWKDYIPAEVAGILMPPIGYGMEERMTAELQAMGQYLVDGAKTAAYRLIPDTVEASVSIPFYSGGGKLTKDGNVFLGGSFTFGNSLTEWFGEAKSSGKAVYPRISGGFGATYFLNTSMTEAKRDAAVSGAEMEIQIQAVTLAKPLQGDGPRSIKFGKPGYGFGASYTSQKILDGGDAINSAVEYFRGLLSNSGEKKPEE